MTSYDVMHDAMVGALQNVIQDAAGWGMLILYQDRGDVPYLVSPAPKLRRYDIVADPVSNKDHVQFDVWHSNFNLKGGRATNPRITKPSLTQAELIDFLHQRIPENVTPEKWVKWVDQTLLLRGHKPRGSN